MWEQNVMFHVDNSIYLHFRAKTSKKKKEEKSLISEICSILYILLSKFGVLVYYVQIKQLH